ncbi:hypothetical protein C7A07_26485, partial [Pseudomonas fragi]
ITHNEAWFDLRKYALRHLVASGVSIEQIQVLEHCTYCHSADLGSYRRRSHQVEPKSFQYSWITFSESGSLNGDFSRSQ